MKKESPIVFVLDDDPSVRRALSRLIRASGLSVQSFATADDFLARPRRKGAQCLVLDLRLTDMSGIELQSRLAKSHQDLPIVFISGYGTEEVRAHALRAGAVDFLNKPFDEDVLMKAIRRALALDPAGRSPERPRRRAVGGIRPRE